MLARLWLPLLGVAPFALAQNPALPAHEVLSYSIEWRLINAGKVRLEWQQARASSQINLKVESVGLVSKLFRVEDAYQADLNQDGCAESTVLTSQEGSRQRETRVTYDGRKASYLERDRVKNAVLLAQDIEIPPCVHDVAGGLYFLRTLNLEPGHSVNVAVSDGKKSVMAKVEAQQREDVKTPEGVFHTIRYEAYLFDNILYRRSAHLYIWLTDDRRKLPVQIRVRMQFAIGTISLLLEKHE
ncbi:MAG: DUF3108 domain-containing protein [Bryobacteraceae bacterium]|jgi:hypothetical protein